MIADRVAPSRADLALDLMWRFLDLAEPVLNRVDDSGGSVGGVFWSACEDLGAIAIKAKPDPLGLADRVFAALLANEYGIYDRLVPTMLPTLGERGCGAPEKPVDAGAGGAVQGGRTGLARRRCAPGLARHRGRPGRRRRLHRPGPAAERGRPRTGAEIGRRLLAAGRAAETLAALEAARPKQRTAPARDDGALYLAEHGGDSAWEAATIEVLDAMGQPEQAQRLRWAAFEDRLSAPQLRAHLKRLPDFEDMEAEDRAKQHALGFRSFSAALHFFQEWPDQAGAAQLVLTRTPEIDGNLYFMLDPAARLVEDRHPLAATLLRRAMIKDTLDGAKSSRYKHAARHLLECASLAPGIEDFGTFETHDAFVGRLRAKHGRKTGFWSQVSEASGSGRR